MTSFQWLLICLGIAAALHSPFVVQGADSTLDTTKDAMSTVSDFGQLVAGIAATSGATTSLTLAIVNNGETELTDPRWYLMDDNELDTPPPEVLKKGETIVMTVRSTVKSTIKFVGTRGILSFKVGKVYLLVVWSTPVKDKNSFLVKLVFADPFPTKDYEKTYETRKKEGFIAGEFGKWYGDEVGGVKMIASMGGANKAPLQIFLN